MEVRDGKERALRSGFVDTGDVRLRYLASGERGRPLLLAPGLSDSAEDYRDVLAALEPRRAIAMSFRGQHGSSAPATGYERIPTNVIEGIQREARSVDLWETLASLSIPRCAVLGGDRSADALESTAARYRQAGAEVVILEGAGHALWEPDLERFVDVLRRFADTTG